MNQPIQPPAGATAVPPPQAPAPDPNKVDENLVIAIALSVKQINQLLFYLGQQKLSDVLDLFNQIKGQGDMALAAMRLGTGQQTKPPEANGGEQTPQTGEKTEDPPPPRRRRN